MGLEFDLCGFVNRLRNEKLVTGALNEWRLKKENILIMFF